MSSQTCSMGIQNYGGCRHTHMPSSHGSIIFQISAITCQHVFRFFVFPYEFTTLFSNDTTLFSQQNRTVYSIKTLVRPTTCYLKVRHFHDLMRWLFVFDLICATYKSLFFIFFLLLKKI